MTTPGHPLATNTKLRELLTELAGFFADVASYQHICEHGEGCERGVLFRIAAYGTNEWSRYALMELSGAPPEVMEKATQSAIKTLQTLRAAVAAAKVGVAH